MALLGAMGSCNPSLNKKPVAGGRLGPLPERGSALPAEEGRCDDCGQYSGPTLKNFQHRRRQMAQMVPTRVLQEMKRRESNCGDECR